MHPFVFQASWFTLRWENIMIVLGVSAGIWLGFRRSAHKGTAYQDTILDLAFWLVIAGVAGARIWEVLFTWQNYVDEPWQMLAFWNGGMSIQGSILGGLIASLIFAWRRGLRAWELLDILAPPVILGQAIGRIGCLLSGDAFGRPVDEVAWFPKALGVVYAQGTPAWYAFGDTPLIPAEGLEMALDFLILGILLWARAEREGEGRTVLLYGLLYSLARFSLEFLRADSLHIAGFKAAQILSLAVIGLSLMLMAVRFRTGEGINKAAG